MSHEIIYTVTGSWPLPVDMLRYDQSHAATSEDRVKIDALSSENAESPEAIRNQVSINLIMRGATKYSRPTTARWESFGWHVPTDAEFYRGRMEQARRRQQDEIVKTALAKLTPAERKVIEQKMEGP